MKGLFVTFEGGEGAGKSSVLQEVAATLAQEGYEVVTTREPGGIDIAEKVRQVILDPSHKEMDSRTEALLYAAARRQHLVEKVIPALQQGMVVLCDRFIDSSLAYQGYARGLGMDEVYRINQFAVSDCMPHVTLLFDIQPEEGLKRIAANEGREQNRLDLEALDFHEKVYEAYQQLANRYSERIKKIDASQSLERVKADTYQVILSSLSSGK